MKSIRFIKALITTIFLLSFSFLFSQQKADWLLSKDDRINYLKTETKKEIIAELNLMVKKYNSFIEESVPKMKIYINTKNTLDKDAYANMLLSVKNPSQAEADFARSMATKRTFEWQIKNRIISLNKDYPEKYKKKKKLTTTWDKLKKHYGGYSQLAEKNITKDRLKDFTIDVGIRRVELLDNNAAKLYLEVSAKNHPAGYEEIYNYYGYNCTSCNYSSRTIEVEGGTYRLPKVSHTDIYKIGKYGTLKNTNYTGPQIEFKFDEIDLSLDLYRLSKGIRDNSDDQNQTGYFNEKIFVSEAEPMKRLMENMIDDLVSDKEFNSINEVKVLRKEIAEKKADELRREKEKDDLIAKWVTFFSEKHDMIKEEIENKSPFLEELTSRDTKSFPFKRYYSLTRYDFENYKKNNGFIKKMKEMKLENLKIAIEYDIDYVSKFFNNKNQNQMEMEQEVEADERKISIDEWLKISANEEQYMCEEFDILVNSKPIKGKYKKFMKAYKKQIPSYEKYLMDEEWGDFDAEVGDIIKFKIKYKIKNFEKVFKDCKN